MLLKSVMLISKFWIKNPDSDLTALKWQKLHRSIIKAPVPFVWNIISVKYWKAMKMLQNRVVIPPLTYIIHFQNCEPYHQRLCNTIWPLLWLCNTYWYECKEHFFIFIIEKNMLISSYSGKSQTHCHVHFYCVMVALIAIYRYLFHAISTLVVLLNLSFIFG